MFKNIVVAFITPTVKTKSFIVGLGMAKKFEADLTVIDCIYKHPPKFHFFEMKSDKESTRKLREKAKESMVKLKQQAKTANIPIKTKIVLNDNLGDWVINYVSSNRVDLLIMDHPHLSSFEETFYEDIIHAILHEVHVPVLTLR